MLSHKLELPLILSCIPTYLLLSMLIMVTSWRKIAQSPEHWTLDVKFPCAKPSLGTRWCDGIPCAVSCQKRNMLEGDYQTADIVVTPTHPHGYHVRRDHVKRRPCLRGTMSEGDCHTTDIVIPSHPHGDHVRRDHVRREPCQKGTMSEGNHVSRGIPHN